MRLRVRLDKVTDGASLACFLRRQDDPHLLTLERIVHAYDEVFYTDAPTRHNHHVNCITAPHL